MNFTVKFTCEVKCEKNWRFHCEITFHGREQFIHGLSFPRWIATDRQVADIFTKPLAQDLFYRFRSVLLNLCGRKHKRSGIFWMFSA